MYIVVLITVPKKKDARKISAALVQKKLAACVNIVDKVDSLFWWQGKVDRAGELLLIVKSTRGRLSRLIALVKSLHGYEVPEIIALPIVAGNTEYLRWIDESLRR